MKNHVHFWVEGIRSSHSSTTFLRSHGVAVGINHTIGRFFGWSICKCTSKSEHKLLHELDFTPATLWDCRTSLWDLWYKESRSCLQNAVHQLVPAMRQGWKTCCTPTNPSGVPGSCYPSPKRQFDSLTVAQLKEKAKEAWLNGPSCAVFGWWTIFATGIYTWCILMYVEQYVRRGLAAVGMCTIPLNMLRNKGLWQVAPSRNLECFCQGGIGATGGLFQVGTFDSSFNSLHQDLLARLKACAKKRPAPKAAAESPEPPAKRGTAKTGGKNVSCGFFVATVKLWWIVKRNRWLCDRYDFFFVRDSLMFGFWHERLRE